MGCGCRDKTDPYADVRAERDRWLRAEVDRVTAQQKRSGNGQKPPESFKEGAGQYQVGDMAPIGPGGSLMRVTAQDLELEKRMAREG